jgi:hypothetical protein
MNVEIGAEAAQFPEQEYIKGILVAGCHERCFIAGARCDNQSQNNHEKTRERDWRYRDYKDTLKKRLSVFLSPAGMSLNRLFMAGNNLIISGQGAFG